MSETPGEYLATDLADEIGVPVSRERIEVLLSHFEFNSDTLSREVGLVVRALHARLADLEPKYAALSVEIQAHDEASDPVHPIAWRRPPAYVEIAGGKMVERTAECRCCAQQWRWSLVGDDGHCVSCSEYRQAQPDPSERGAAILAAAEAMAAAWETPGYAGHWSRMKTTVDAYRALVPAPSTPKE